MTKLCAPHTAAVQPPSGNHCNLAKAELRQTSSGKLVVLQIVQGGKQYWKPSP